MDATAPAFLDAQAPAGVSANWAGAGTCPYIYNLAVSRWKTERARKKEAGPPSVGRLLSCLVVLIGGLVLFFLLFSALLTKR